MKKSYFFQRMVMLTFATLFLFAALTGGIFYYVSRDIMINQTIEQLEPSARSIASQLITLRSNNADNNTITKLLDLSGLPNARIHIFTAEGRLEFYPEDEVYVQMLLQVQEENPQMQVDEYRSVQFQQVMENRSRLYDLLPQVLEGYMVTQIIEPYIIVGVPAVDPMTNEITEAVFVSRTVQDVYDLRNSLYATLFLSMAVVASLMIIAVLIVSRRISRPVNSMRDIALRMAHGNFFERADETMPGELGQLAGSLNLLSGELSKTIRELSIERNRLLSILDGLNEGILAVDSEMCITHINPAMEDLFGPYDAYCDGEKYINDPEFWEDLREVVEGGGTLIRLRRVRNIVLRISIAPLEEKEEIVGAVALLRDETESERLEQTRRDYVANVSHELRTPVSSLLTLAETLQDGMIKSEDDRQRYYGYMIKESQRLSNLINDLLELSRLQSGNVALRNSRVDMEEMLYDIGDRFSLMSKNQGVRFLLEGAEDCPMAYTNPDRMEQIAFVLLDNALKFTPEGGTITLEATWNEEKITLSVKDTGCGITPEDLPHLFDRFYKVDKAHSGGGTGLGLSIASEIQALMGEKIWAESEEGQGSAFCFTIQRYLPQDQLPQEAPETPKLESGGKEPV